MEKLGILPVEQQFNYALQEEFDAYVETLSNAYVNDSLEEFSSTKESYFSDIQAMSQSFLQLVENSHTTYAQDSIAYGISFTYDLAKHLVPPSHTVVPSNIFEDMGLEARPTRYEVRTKMTRIANEYLDSRPHVTEIITYFLPLLDPEHQLHDELTLIISYVLLHIELNECDEFIDSEVMAFRQQMNIWPANPGA